MARQLVLLKKAVRNSVAMKTRDWNARVSSISLLSVLITVRVLGRADFNAAVFGIEIHISRHADRLARGAPNGLGDIEPAFRRFNRRRISASMPSGDGTVVY
jgi:hypothetical protein